MTKLWLLWSLSMVLLAAQSVHAQTVSVDQQSLTFTAEVGGPPTSLALNVSASSSVIVLATAVEQTDSQVSWLSVNPAGGQTPLPLTVTVNPGSLTAGSYSGSVVIQPFGGGNSVTVPVTLTVGVINVTPPSLTFTTSVGNTPAASSVTLESAQSVSYTAAATTTTGGNWLQVSPPFGIVSGFSAVSAIPNAAVVPQLTPGTYNGTITITPTSGNSTTPVTIPVMLTVTPAPTVTVNPSTVNLEYQIGGATSTAQQSIILSTPSSQGVAFSISATSQPNPSGGVWVLPNPIFGQITSAGTQVQISYNIAANLPTGNWTSTITVNTPNGSPAATSIPVNLVISNQPLLIVPGNTLTFSYELGTANPVAQGVNITSTSSTPQSYTVATTTTDGASWLVAPATGTTSGPLSVSVNPAGLTPGSYTGTVTVTGVGTGNGALQFPVSLKVSDDPVLVTNLTALALTYEIGQTQAVSAPIAVSSSNGVPLNFSASATSTTCGNWLAVGSASGTTSGTVTVSVNPAGLSAGACKGTVQISATNTLTGAIAIGSPVTIPVTLTVSGSSLLVVSPLTPAVFSAQQGGTAPAAQTYTLTSSDSQALNFSVATNATSGGSGWLNVSQINGSTSGSNSLQISVQPGQLTPGTYTGTVTVTATGSGGVEAANSPLTIPVTFQVTAGALSFNQTSLTFQQAAGGPAPTNQVVNVTSTGQPLSFATVTYNSGSVNWLTASPSGSTPGSISVGVNAANLPLGTYHGSVAVLSTTPNAGNSPTLIPVTLQVNTGTLAASLTGVTFTQVQGGNPPLAENVNLTGSPLPLPFTVSETTATGGAWLGIAPGSGTTPNTVQIYVAANSLQPGTYSGTVTIVSPGAGGSPISIPVVLSVVPAYVLSVSPQTTNLNAAVGSSAVQTAQISLASTGATIPYTLTTSGASWLSATPASGTAPGAITLSANPTGLVAGAYTGTVTITSPDAVSPVTATVNLVVGTVAAPAISAVANASSYGTGAVAPGENVVIFGSGIGPAQLTHGTVTNGVVDSTLAATRVLFDGIPAPILYADSTQTSAMVPYELSGHAVTNLVVEYQGVPSPALPYTVVPAAPGIYTQNAQGSGPGAILNQNYSVNLPNAPAPKGSVVSVYITGEGFISGAVDGSIATNLLSPVLPVTATVGGIPATVTYAGTSPGIVTGATQVNVQIPANAPSGSAVPIFITVGAGSSAVKTQAAVTIAIQ